jgi:hypothetical protein
MWSWQVNSSVGRSTPRASSHCSCQSSLLINVQVYASQVCRLCPPTNALFQCDLPGPPLPPHSVPPCRRPHCCMPVAPPALNSPCADRDPSPQAVPVTPVCWPNSSRRTDPTDSHPSISSLQHPVRLLATWSRRQTQQRYDPARAFLSVTPH